MPIDHKRWKKISIEKLVPADWNYKEDDEAKSVKLKNNIKRNGQIENIIVRKFPEGKYEVVNGNHRLQTFIELGFKKAVCYSLGTISDAQARRVAIETNETKFETDDAKLGELIDEIVEDGIPLEELAETLPFDEQQMEGLRSLMEFDFDAEFEERVKDTEKEEEEPELICPECGHSIKEH